MLIIPVGSTIARVREAYSDRQRWIAGHRQHVNVRSSMGMLISSAQLF